MPTTVEIRLEPGSEVHRLVGRRNTDVREVAEHVTGGDVQGPAERDRKMGEITTHAPSSSIRIGCAGPRIGRAGCELKVTVDEVDDRLHPPPAWRQVAEQLPSFVGRCLARLKELGLAILVIDKNVGTLTRVADRHFLIERGRVVWSGLSNELAAAPDVQRRYLGV